MKKISKKRQVAFTKRIIAFLDKVKAEHVAADYEGQNRFKVDTIHGKLNVFLPEDHEFCFSVFCRFDGSQETFEKIGDFRINKYSGKWNFHYSSEIDCLNEFETEVENILIK